MHRHSGAHRKVAAAARSKWRPPDVIFRLLLYWIVFALGGFLLTAKDPFGFELLARKYSQDLINQIFGGDYPNGWLFGGPKRRDGVTGQDAITVVLTDQASLDGWAEYWPPSFGFHAAVLDKICEQSPKAVMIDIFFRDRRGDGTLDQLQGAIHRCLCANTNDGKGVAVYIASPTESDRHGVLPELMVQGSCGRAAIPVRVPKVTDAQDRGNREYPLVVSENGHSGPTAALQLFQGHLCRDGVAATECGLGIDEYHDPMQVFWGTRLPQVNNPGCNRPDGTWIGALVRRVFGSPDEDRLNCPFTQTLSALNVLQIPPVQEPHTMHPSARLLADKVVLYAMYVNGAGDLVYPATHKKLPGVYLHAMALDNLVTYGSSYLRALPQGLEVRSGSVTARVITFDMIVLGLFASVASVRRTQRDYEEQHTNHDTDNEGHVKRDQQRVSLPWFVWHICTQLVCWVATTVGVKVAVLTVAGVVGVYLLRLAPLNWLGYLVLVEGGEWLIGVKERVQGGVEDAWSASQRNVQQRGGQGDQ